ncbi:MAG: tRNA modification GTPase TrmE [Acidobacteriaceae bacterium]|nr:tRNA modification GTPase TrmE [Acidobacteriaceae bacterium]
MPELGLDEDEDTIVAVSTPPGRGGIGVVRLSGGDALAVVGPMLRLKRPLTAGRARFGFVIDTVTYEILDETVVTYFAGPHSYTGEDVVEVAVHGSPALLDYVVRACCTGGARLAEAGEFTQRAFLRGRIDLTQAEAVDDLIQSQTMEQARVAARQLGGALARVVAPVKEQLVGLIAGLEAGIDFAEDDIDVMPADAVLAAVDAVVVPLQELARSFEYGRVVREGFSLAIVGRPNAGKSSLFNRLVERERAIVTATPGTTRDLVTERVSIEGIPVEMIDTAGLRESADEAERLGIAKSREAMADADVVVVVIDAVVGIHPEDELVLAGLEGRAHVVVWNKWDLVGSTNGADGVRVSALTGEGIAALRRVLVGMVSGGGAASSSAMVTNVRQQQAVAGAIAALERASGAVGHGVPHEMVLLDLYEGLASLDSLTGATTSDDVLHLIFSKFCIGK